MKNKSLYIKLSLSLLFVLFSSFAFISCSTTGITVDTVKEAINTLPNPAYLTEDDKAAIDEVYNKYKELSKEDQKKVPNVEKLKTSLNSIKAFSTAKESIENDFNVANDFNAKIKNMTEKDKDKLKSEYENLTDAQKTLVVGADKFNK